MVVSPSFSITWRCIGVSSVVSTDDRPLLRWYDTGTSRFGFYNSSFGQFINISTGSLYFDSYITSVGTSQPVHTVSARFTSVSSLFFGWFLVVSADIGQFIPISIGLGRFIYVQASSQFYSTFLVSSQLDVIFGMLLTPQLLVHHLQHSRFGCWLIISTISSQ